MSAYPLFLISCYRKVIKLFIDIKNDKVNRFIDFYEYLHIETKILQCQKALSTSVIPAALAAFAASLILSILRL